MYLKNDNLFHKNEIKNNYKNYQKNIKNFLKDLDSNDINYWFDSIKYWTIEQAAFLLSGYHPIMPYDDFNSYRIPFEVKKFLITMTNKIFDSKILVEKYKIENSSDFPKNIFFNKIDIMKFILDDEDFYNQLPYHKSCNFNYEFFASYVRQ